MRGFIPAAGLGTRLRPITDHIPKPLADTGRSTLLEHAYGNLRSSGIRSVGINFSYLAEKGISFCRTNIDSPIHIFREPVPTGAFGGVNNFIKALSPEDILVHNGDIFYDGVIDTKGLSSSEACLYACLNGMSDLIVDADDNLIRIGDVLDHKEAMGYGGIIFLGREIVTFLAGLYPRDRYVSFIKDIINPIMEKGFKITVRCLDGFWSDAGTPETLKEIQKYNFDVDN